MRAAATSAWARPVSARFRPLARPGSVVPVEGVWPWRTSRTVVAEGGAVGAAGPAPPTGIAWPGTWSHATRIVARWIRCRRYANSEIVACRACPRLVAWREEVARTSGPRSVTSRTGVGPSPASATRGRGGGRRSCRPPRTAPIAPGACSPATSPASGSTAPCGGRASPANPIAPRSTTGWSSPVRGSPRRCGARRRPTGPRPTSGRRCRPFIDRELGLAHPGPGVPDARPDRVPGHLRPAGGAAPAALRPRAGGARDDRPGGAVHHRPLLVPREPTEHVHGTADPSRCSTR